MYNLFYTVKTTKILERGFLCFDLQYGAGVYFRYYYVEIIKLKYKKYMKEGMPTRRPRFNEGARRKLEGLFAGVEDLFLNGSEAGLDMGTQEKLRKVAEIMDSIKSDMDKDR